MFNPTANSSAIMDPNSSNGQESADGTLVIIVCRAKHLPNRRKLDKQSPYVTIRMGTTAKKTPAHFRGGQIPEWTHEVRFQLSRERKPVIKLDVLDETKNDPTPIGTCDIDCSAIFSPGNKQDGKYIHDKWYDLTLNGRRAGRIYLEMTFYPSAPVLPPKLYTSVSKERLSSTPGSLSSSGTSAKGLPVPPPQHRPLSAADEVFVSAAEANKRKGFFKSLSGGQVPQAENANDEEPVESRSPNKYLNKLNKFKSKFQAKEKISTLWVDSRTDPKLAIDGVEPLDISQFDNLDQLQTDLQTHTFRPSSPVNAYGVSEGVYTTSPGRYYEGSPSDDDITPPSPPPRSFTSPSDSTPIRRRKPSDKTSRKPPPEVELRNNMAKLNVSGESTGIPFSADTIDLEDENDEHMPTKVYFMDKQVKSLSYKALPLAPDEMNTDEIDPKYYAPTPDEHFKRTQYSGMTREKFIEEMKKNDTGYLGNGRWKEDTKFSPSIFDRMPNDENLGFENKPHVPPKIPQGLTEKEYYVLEKEKYLKDINGKRS